MKLTWPIVLNISPSLLHGLEATVEIYLKIPKNAGSFLTADSVECQLRAYRATRHSKANRQIDIHK